MSVKGTAKVGFEMFKKRYAIKKIHYPKRCSTPMQCALCVARTNPVRLVEAFRDYHTLVNISRLI